MKRGFAFSFAWIFAIIAGAVILFIALFATTRFFETGERVSETRIGKEIGTLLTPIETSIEEGKFSKISLSEESTISAKCIDLGTFGSQRIQIGSGVPSAFFNKYLFSSGEITGNDLYVFTKPFKMPFKIADLSVVWSDKEEYCFADAPKVISEDIEKLGLTGISSVSSVSDCSLDSVKVCFSQAGCDVNVFTSEKRVEKSGQDVFYDDTFGSGLLYGAIFSEPEIYECQVKRLMGRASELSLIYLEKSNILDSEGCSSDISSDLSIFASSLDIPDSKGIAGIADLAKKIDKKNENSQCEIY